MGYYVNPSTESKESFLEREGKVVPLSHYEWEDLPKEYLPVMLVDNGMFTAAAVCYSKKELKEFKDPSNRRRKVLLIVKVEKLLPVTPDLESFLARNEK